MAIPLKAPVIVLGAAAGFGAELVAAILEAGKSVIGVGLERAELGTLAAQYPGRSRVVALAGSTQEDAQAADLAAALRAMPVMPLQAIVNFQGPCVRGRVLDQPPQVFEQAIRGRLLPQLHAARHLLPLLARSGRCARYLVVGTPYAGTPWAGYGPYSVAAAAIRMLVQVLRQESEGTPVRVQQLVIDTPVRDALNAHCACPDWPDATDVARSAAALLDRPAGPETFIQFDSRSGQFPQATAEVIA
jgi:NAD(P)-dependent dehydrogenase (short-subunit alcohol dehydrogenase family)